MTANMGSAGALAGAGAAAQPPTGIRTDQLTKRYGRRAAVDHLSILDTTMEAQP
jgi:hypothetical protein